jgi:hypothetical protein
MSATDGGGDSGGSGEQLSHPKSPIVDKLMPSPMDRQLVVSMEHEEFEHDNWDGLRMKEETLGQRLGWLVRMNLRTRYAARRIPWKKAFVCLLLCPKGGELLCDPETL